MGLIGGIASVDWGFAIQIMAVATIGSGGTFVPTNGKVVFLTFCYFVLIFNLRTGQIYAAYLAVLLSHAIVCSLATQVLARLQSIYVMLNLG
jgi:hypothetical protein